MALIGRGIRTCGGLGNVVQKRPSKQQEQVMLEEKWKREDRTPNIPSFTGVSQINVDFPEDATPLNFLDLFLEDKFYELNFSNKSLCSSVYCCAYFITLFSC